MVPSDLVKAGEWDKIEQLTREAVHAMLGFDLAHIGVNCQSEPEARKAAERMAFLFGLPQRINSGGTFVGKIVEVLKICGNLYERGNRRLRSTSDAETGLGRQGRSGNAGERIGQEWQRLLPWVRLC